MKISLYLMVIAGLLIIGGCKSPMLNNTSVTELDSVERLSLLRDDDSGSIQQVSFETLAGEHLQQTSPPGRVANEDYLKQGHIAGRQGHIEEARKLYDLVLRNDPDNVTAHHRLAVIADKQQDFQTAEQHYLTALRHQPYNSDMLADFGYSYFLQKRFEKSDQYLSRALESNPSHQRTLNNLGLLYGTMGDYDRALEMLRRTGSESEAREKLAKIFPRSADDMSNRSPIASQYSSGSQHSNPLTSRELTAPNPRGVASRNFQAGNPQIDQFMDRREIPSSRQENFDSTRTAGNSVNPLRPAVLSTIDPNYPTDTSRGSSGGFNISWPQPGTQPLGTTRLQPNQLRPQQSPYQPADTFGQPIPTDVRPVQQQATTPNRLLPAMVYPAEQTQFSNDGITNFRTQNSYQAMPTSGAYNVPNNQLNPVNNGFPEYQNYQPFSNGVNLTPGSISNFPAQNPAFNQPGTAVPDQWQGNRYAPQPATASVADYQFQNFPVGQTGSGPIAGSFNTAGNQPEAFRLYEERQRLQSAPARTVQQFPQTVPQPQPGIVPAWPQDSQQFPAAHSPRIQIGRQPNPQGMANPSYLR